MSTWDKPPLVPDLELAFSCLTRSALILVSKDLILSFVFSGTFRVLYECVSEMRTRKDLATLTRRASKAFSTAWGSSGDEHSLSDPAIATWDMPFMAATAAWTRERRFPFESVESVPDGL